MRYFKSEDGMLIQSNFPISSYTEITEEEYLAIQEENRKLAAEQELEAKKALLKQLMAELGESAP